jgi:hypothetical protein
VPPGPTLSGLVFESTSGGAVPLTAAHIEVWVDQIDRGYAAESVTTDEKGRYVIRNLPSRSVVVLIARSDARLSQPTAATMTMDGDAELDVELVSKTNPVRTQRGSPTLSGTVYERTVAGTRPVRAASVSFDWGCDDGAPEAETVTDAAGRYELSRLPLSHRGGSCVTASAGNRVKSFGVEFRGDAALDIDLTENVPSLSRR